MRKAITGAALTIARNNDAPFTPKASVAASDIAKSGHDISGVLHMVANLAKLGRNYGAPSA